MGLKVDSIQLDSLTADPSSPEDGELWYNSTSGKAKLRKGGQNKDLAETDQVTDEKARVSANDTVTGYFADKIVAGDGVIVTELNDGGNETLEVKLALKNNLAASAAPGATDDSAAGYAVGSLWVDTTADTYYFCVDATATSAVWDDGTGPQGPQGNAGADGDVTWEGAWVSQNYTANQAVEYNGTSYVCKLNTVASEVPTNATYWDMLASKGDVGATGLQSIDFTVSRASNPWFETKETSYEVADDLVFRGTTAMGTPSAIKVIAWSDGGAAWVRIYDVTNSLVICEASTTALTKVILNLGTLSNLPAGEAIWEVQIKRTGGGPNDDQYLSSVQIQF